jgi:hypothetical protein
MLDKWRTALSAEDIAPNGDGIPEHPAGGFVEMQNIICSTAT